jgi:acetyl-CoA C-acetyltransferase
MGISNIKAITLAAQSIATGYRQVMVAGGMESMSNVPFYSPRNARYGHQTLLDGIVHDGLWDAYNNVHMGTCAENTAVTMGITRKEMDAHAISSYQKSASAWASGVFKNEVVPVTLPNGKQIIEDEEFKNVKFDKIPSLKPVFKKDGSVTAANASTLNDGASAMILMSEASAKSQGLKPIAEIISFADAACAPIDFPIAPSLAIPLAMKRAGLSINDIALWEINEAFSVVVLANEKKLGMDSKKVNVAGGAVSLGHPIGSVFPVKDCIGPINVHPKPYYFLPLRRSSGARIVVTLANLLKSGEFGCAAIWYVNLSINHSW